MNDATKVFWKNVVENTTAFLIGGIVGALFTIAIVFTAFVCKRSTDNQSTTIDNTAIDSEIKDNQSAIDERFAAIDERFANIDGIISSFPGEFAKVRSAIGGLAGNINDGLTADRELIQQLGGINDTINGLDGRIRAAQIGAGEIGVIADTIDGAADEIGKRLKDSQNMELDIGN